MFSPCLSIPPPKPDSPDLVPGACLDELPGPRLQQPLKQTHVLAHGCELALVNPIFEFPVCSLFYNPFPVTVPCLFIEVLDKAAQIFLLFGVGSFQDLRCSDGVGEEKGFSMHHVLLCSEISSVRSEGGAGAGNGERGRVPLGKVTFAVILPPEEDGCCVF